MPNMAYYGLANIHLSSLEQPLEVTVDLKTERETAPEGTYLLSWKGIIVNPAPFMRRHFINSMMDSIVIILPNGKQGNAYISEVTELAEHHDITSRGSCGAESNHYREYIPGRTSIRITIVGCGPAPYHVM